MTQQDAEALADQLRDMIAARLNLMPYEALVCPRSISEMTPCVARDGGVCAVLDSVGNPLCVGCETRIDRRVAEEQARASSPSSPSAPSS